MRPTSYEADSTRKSRSIGPGARHVSSLRQPSEPPPLAPLPPSPEVPPPPAPLGLGISEPPLLAMSPPSPVFGEPRSPGDEPSERSFSTLRSLDGKSAAGEPAPSCEDDPLARPAVVVSSEWSPDWADWPIASLPASPECDGAATAPTPASPLPSSPVSLGSRCPDLTSPVGMPRGRPAKRALRAPRRSRPFLRATGTGSEAAAPGTDRHTAARRGDGCAARAAVARAV